MLGRISFFTPFEMVNLLGTNISPKKGTFEDWWDMLVPCKVTSFLFIRKCVERHVGCGVWGGFGKHGSLENFKPRPLPKQKEYSNHIA